MHPHNETVKDGGANKPNKTKINHRKVYNVEYFETFEKK